MRVGAAVGGRAHLVRPAPRGLAELPALRTCRHAQCAPAVERATLSAALVRSQLAAQRPALCPCQPHSLTCRSTTTRSHPARYCRWCVTSRRVVPARGHKASRSPGAAASQAAHAGDAVAASAASLPPNRAVRTCHDARDALLEEHLAHARVNSRQRIIKQLKREGGGGSSESYLCPHEPPPTSRPAHLHGCLGVGCTRQRQARLLPS